MPILTNVLDVTSWHDKDLELKQRIDKEVKSFAKSSLIVTLPDVLRMTQSQYDQLMKLNQLPNMYHTEDRMYQTPYSVMEVRVQGRNKLTFKEAHSLDDQQFEEWEKSVEGESGE